MAFADKAKDIRGTATVYPANCREHPAPLKLDHMALYKSIIIIIIIIIFLLLLLFLILVLLYYYYYNHG